MFKSPDCILIPVPTATGEIKLITAFMIGTLYLLFGAFPLIFAHIHGLVGTFFGALLDPSSRWNVRRLVILGTFSLNSDSRLLF